MEVTEIIINGEVYTVTKRNGNVVTELKMTDAQKTIINMPKPIVDPLADIRADLAEIKAELKLIKNKP